jgi:hypothetical protein
MLKNVCGDDVPVLPLVWDLCCQCRQGCVAAKYMKYDNAVSVVAGMVVVEVCTGPGSSNNIRVRVGPNRTFGFGYGSGSTGIFRAFAGHLSTKKKLFVFTRNSWHSQKISAQSDLALLVLQTRKARGQGIHDWCQREGSPIL